MKFVASENFYEPEVQDEMEFLRFLRRFRRLQRRWLAIILILPLPLCHGCQATGRNLNAADVKIIPGESAGEKFPAVQIVHINSRICSGTLIDTRHLLTVAHCLMDKNGEVLAPQNVKVGVTREAALRIDVHPSYKSLLETDSDYDVGIVTLSDNPNRSVASFSRFQPRLGELVTMVGYGRGSRTEADVISEKRLGTNRISQFRGSSIFIDKDSRDSVTDHALLGPGDSGSGIFDTRGELIAVGISGSEVFSRAVLVSHTQIRDFLIQFLQGTEPRN